MFTHSLVEHAWPGTEKEGTLFVCLFIYFPQFAEMHWSAESCSTYERKQFSGEIAMPAFIGTTGNPHSCPPSISLENKGAGTYDMG